MNEELNKLSNAFEKAGEEKSVFDSDDIGKLVINKNVVLMKTEVKGLHIEEKSIEDGVFIKIKVDPNTKIEKPVHLCFGMLPKNGKQVIKSDFLIGKNSSVTFLAHCSFPNAEDIQHLMVSNLILEENAVMKYSEQHYHSELGGTYVNPIVRATLKQGAQLFENFKLIKGKVGKLDIDYSIEQEKDSVAEIVTKVYGKGNDEIDVKESLYLNGENSAGTAKSRIVLLESAKGNVFGEIQGNAKYSRGHIDCNEVVHGDKAIASSTPKISVSNPFARVTHEAAIGRINKKELETMMARGLSEEEAIDMIVKGILK